MSDHTALLALLEERPYTIAELVPLLAVNHWTLRDRIALLAAQGVVVIQRRPPQPFLVALGAPAPTPPPPGAKAKASIGAMQFGKHARKANELPIVRTRTHLPPRERVEQFLAIDASHPGTDVCGSCGKRFVALRSSERFCSTRCADTGPPAATVTRVINGVTFECTSIGSRPIGTWPESSKATGSSLSGMHGVARPADA